MSGLLKGTKSKHTHNTEQGCTAVTSSAFVSHPQWTSERSREVNQAAAASKPSKIGPALAFYLESLGHVSPEKITPTGTSHSNTTDCQIDFPQREPLNGSPSV